MHSPNFLFMDENTLPHCYKIVTAGLQEFRVANLAWLIVSPDLNPIEHICNHGLAELHVALEEEWNTLPQTIMRLLRSMLANVRDT
uniref:Tc1-like transposase DDE domain-containing protein n=1 Tax=Oryzias latipes TaxID=8090 RepID=A0A3P9LIJ5_ORYLA